MATRRSTLEKFTRTSRGPRRQGRKIASINRAQRYRRDLPFARLNHLFFEIPTQLINHGRWSPVPDRAGVHGRSIKQIDLVASGQQGFEEQESVGYRRPNVASKRFPLTQVQANVGLPGKRLSPRPSTRQTRNGDPRKKLSVAMVMPPVNGLPKV